MIETGNVVIVGGLRCCAEVEAFRAAYVESIRAFRQISAELRALPDCAQPERYFPQVIALQNATREANQAHDNYHQHPTGHKS